MAECNDTYEIDVEDLADALMTNGKDDMKTFDDFLNLKNSRWIRCICRVIYPILE